MSYYLALVYAAPDGLDFTCPDLPGFNAHSDSASLDDAAAIARTVLADHLAAMKDAGLPWPEARPLTALFNDPALRDELDEAVTTMMLPALTPAGRTQRVNLSLDENTIDLIDRAAKERGLTRSGFVAEAARSLVAPKGRAPYTFGGVRPTDSKWPESLSFDLHINGRTIDVTVSREAMDDHSEKVGIDIANLADGYVEFLEMYQPEFAAVAVKRHRLLEDVTITSRDLVGA